MEISVRELRTILNRVVSKREFLEFLTEKSCGHVSLPVSTDVT